MLTSILHSSRPLLCQPATPHHICYPTPGTLKAPLPTAVPHPSPIPPPPPPPPLATRPSIPPPACPSLCRVPPTIPTSRFQLSSLPLSPPSSPIPSLYPSPPPLLHPPLCRLLYPILLYPPSIPPSLAPSLASTPHPSRVFSSSLIKPRSHWSVLSLSSISLINGF